MEWMPGAQTSFNKIFSESQKDRYELFILSAVNFSSGIEGKKLWVSTHTSFSLAKVIIVPHGEDKAKYASKDSILIDDKDTCLLLFKDAGGRIIKFNDWESCLKSITFLF